MNANIQRRLRTSLLVAFSMAIVTYIATYIHARRSGLFIWALMRGAYRTPEKKSTIIPICNVSLVILPTDEMTDEEYSQRSAALISKKDKAKALWPFFEHLAAVEVMCSPSRAAQE
jgi:hypothetical protein